MLRITTLIIVFLSIGSAVWASDQDAIPRITLRAWGVPDGMATNIEAKASRRVIAAYQEKLPHVRLETTTGLTLGGAVESGDMTPLMQIAGDIAPHVMFVNFRQSDTYIRNKFLYPLDRYIEQACANSDDPCYIADSHLMSLDDYLAELQKLPRYNEEILQRVPRQCWQVMRRRCPYQADCPYCREWNIEPAEEHYHVWCFPQGPSVMAFFYRKDLFAEAQLPDRLPQNWQELLEWSRILTNPAENKYGLFLDLRNLSWSTLSFLYSTGGRIVEQNEHGEWFCVFDSDPAVEAYYFVARLLLEPFANEHGVFYGAVFTGDSTQMGIVNIAMQFIYLDTRFFYQHDINLYGFGPVPAGPTGLRGSEFNSIMTGIYAGYGDDVPLRDAAWEYIRFFDGQQARLIRTRVYVEEGAGRFVRPSLLRQAGFDEYVRQVPPQWEENFQKAQEFGVPEPYGKNCQLVYNYVTKGIDQIRTDGQVRQFIRGGSDLQFDRLLGDRYLLSRLPEQLQNDLSAVAARLDLPAVKQTLARGQLSPDEASWHQLTIERFEAATGLAHQIAQLCPPAISTAATISEHLRPQFRNFYEQLTQLVIRDILHQRVQFSNQKMLNILPPRQQRSRAYIAAVVVVAILGIFLLVFRKVLQVFAAQVPVTPGHKRGRWEFFRFRWAYILLIPAVGSIALWAYYPLLRGTIMAFQDYNVRGFSRFVGMDNFAHVLWDDEFWFSLWVTLKYTIMYVFFGFGAPIILAFLLTEVPKGKIVYRTIYYLPAMLSGVVVMFLWKGFYGESGMINQMLNFFIGLLNHLPGVALAEVHTHWLESPQFALFFCLLPSIWAGLGPGCLIYLAALKTIPDDLYEAADIDGAGMLHKARHIALPGIKALILINFIGVMISTMQTGGGMMLAMTGGGPFTPYGQTEVTELHIFWEAFGYLRFGTAVSMAWILGSILIGFTVVQMQKLSKMEFKTAQGV